VAKEWLSQVTILLFALGRCIDRNKTWSEDLYGINDDPNDPGQGSGKGLGSGVMLWIGTAEITLLAYHANCYRVAVQHSFNVYLVFILH